jgi:DNA repair exonuclease SbcCD ATPase subunit
MQDLFSVGAENKAQEIGSNNKETVNEQETLGIKKVTFQNYKNIKSKTYVLNGDSLLLEGRNGLGKTNVLEGIFWAISGNLFDGTSKGDKQEVKPIGSDKDVEVSVKIEFMRNGFTFERRVKEKYSKQDEYKGNETTLLVNGAVEKNLSTAITSLQRYLGIYDLQSRFNENPLLSAINVFELLWNANTLRTMDYKQIRAIIIDMVGEVDFKDIINENPNRYKALVEPLKQHGLSLDALKSSTRNAIFDKNGGLELMKKVIEKTIEEYEAKGNEVVDENEVKEAKAKVEEINKKVEKLKIDLTKSTSDLTRDIDTKIADIKLKLMYREGELTKAHNIKVASLKDTKADDTIYELEKTLNDYKTEKYTLNNKISSKQNDKNDIERQITSKQNQMDENYETLEELTNKFNELQSPEDSPIITCPYCQTPFKQHESLEYQAHIDKELDKINAKGLEITELNESLAEGLESLNLSKDKLLTEILALQKQREQLEGNIETLENDIKDLKAKATENQAELPILDIESDSEIKEFRKELNDLETQKTTLSDNAKENQDKMKLEIYNLEQERETFSEILSKEQTAKSYLKSADDKRKELDKVNKDLTNKNAILTLIKELEKDMYSRLDEKVANVFGENIGFQLYKLNVSNGEYDTRMCEIYVKDYHDTMVNIKRINTGMFPIRATEIIHKIKEFYKLPTSFIFVDEVASLDSEHKKMLLNYGEQVLATAVSESNKIEEKRL